MNPYEQTLRKVSDPLREETRNVRKTLLVWSLVAAAVTVGGLFPAEVTALGLKITPTNKVTLFTIFGAVLVYHLVAFLSYAAADFAHWYVNLRSTNWEVDFGHYEKYKAELLARTKLSADDQALIEEQERRLGSLWRGEALSTFSRLEDVVPHISTVRALVDFLLPPAAGLVAVGLLINAA